MMGGMMVYYKILYLELPIYPGLNLPHPALSSQILYQERSQQWLERDEKREGGWRPLSCSLPLSNIRWYQSRQLSCFKRGIKEVG
jgi:hypothetical protein